MEEARAPTSLFVRAFGSLAGWEASCQAGIDEGRFDPIDMPYIMNAVSAWHVEAVWRR